MHLKDIRKLELLCTILLLSSIPACAQTVLQGQIDTYQIRVSLTSPTQSAKYDQSLAGQTKAEMGAIGAHIENHIIDCIYPHMPLIKSDVKLGDQIIAVDWIDCTNYTDLQINTCVWGPIGTPVTITFLRHIPTKPTLQYDDTGGHYYSTEQSIKFTRTFIRSNVGIYRKYYKEEFEKAHVAGLLP